ncbi:MAG: hypothetical protein C0407_06005 [Desulfobacca sp.]|nr:hypothetical protein [Desulfobacca sp.]
MKPNPIVTCWQQKAGEDLASAEENFRASRLTNAVRDAYYLNSCIKNRPIDILSQRLCGVDEFFVLKLEFT